MFVAQQGLPSRARRAVLLAAVVVTAVSVTACAKSEDTGSNAPSGGGGGAQVTKTTAASGPSCTMQQYGATKLDLKNAVVGFAQSEKEANPFRIAETASIKDEAGKLGVKKLLTTNANSDLGKQISDIQSMIAQGAQALIVAPLNSEGLEPALKAARDKNIPVITIDRKLSTATLCKDYVTFIGSDFVEQGKRAGEKLSTATGGTGKVAILLGASGNNVTTDRTAGFKDYLKTSAPGLQVVAEQSGEFTREKGQSVTENLLQAHPDITAVYAENDEMALGAVTAIRSAGKKPGTDVKVVSVDGTRNVVQAIVKGDVNADIESNPRFGPLAFSTLQDFFAGKPISGSVIIEDKQYDKDNAATEVANAY
jgi:ribose transport system substrate-binding protein